MKIVVENLSYVYSGMQPSAQPALKDISLQIGSNEFVALVGPTGSGKTTLVQHFTRLLEPTSGRVLIDGCDLTDKRTNLNEARRRIGLVFQFPETQLFEETVFADVAFGPRNLGLEESQVDAQVRMALDLVGMEAERFKNRSPHHLSEGEKRRVAIAGVLAMNPEVLVLDEPTACLDPHGTRRIEGILRRLHVEGKTVVLISHNMNLVARLAERVLLLCEGRLLYNGPKGELFERGDFLRSVGLDLPRITYCIRSLIREGVPLRGDIYSVEEVEKELTRGRVASQGRMAMV